MIWWRDFKKYLIEYNYINYINYEVMPICAKMRNSYGFFFLYYKLDKLLKAYFIIGPPAIRFQKFEIEWRNNNGIRS